MPIFKEAGIWGISENADELMPIFMEAGIYGIYQLK